MSLLPVHHANVKGKPSDFSWRCYSLICQPLELRSVPFSVYWADPELGARTSISKKDDKADKLRSFAISLKFEEEHGLIHAQIE